MCGIAGAIDLDGQRPLPRGMLAAMAAAIVHRGPDEDGFREWPGVGFASRRLSLVGLADGRQPISNEAGDVTVVYNGELFDHQRLRADLESKGHRFRTHTDTEVIPHLYEDHGEGLLERLGGQFAFALWDAREQTLVLARDRFGICPLYWTRVTTPSGEWLLFASEVKALLASGLVEPRLDPIGLEHAFTFLGVPGPTTCFQGVHLLPPGQVIRVTRSTTPARVTRRAYWELSFPDRGHEEDGSEDVLVRRFEELLLAAVEKRLRADVPVVSYLSGGVDSSIVVAMASKLRGEPIPAFTVQIADSALDERDGAAQVAAYTRSPHTVVRYGPGETANILPRLVGAAEAPVLDTSCGALLMLSGAVREHGYKAVLTGEGSDEWLAGYLWYKVQRVLEAIDSIPGLDLSNRLRRLFAGSSGTIVDDWVPQVQRMLGGSNAWMDFYGLMNMNRERFFSRELDRKLGKHWPYEELELDPARMSRWHWLNRSLFIGARAHLAGLLLNQKGDRVAMASSVETRYPFLDEEVAGFLARLHPRWKLRFFTDKYLLRKLAERWLPRDVAWRSKAMFRTPAGGLSAIGGAPLVDQLLSPESLARTGYFDAERVARWRREAAAMSSSSSLRISIDMGLVGVISTQLWHHLFVEGALAELPGAVRRVAATGA